MLLPLALWAREQATACLNIQTTRRVARTGAQRPTTTYLDLPTTAIHNFVQQPAVYNTPYYNNQNYDPRITGARALRGRHSKVLRV